MLATGSALARPAAVRGGGREGGAAAGASGSGRGRVGEEAPAGAPAGAAGVRGWVAIAEGAWEWGERMCCSRLARAKSFAHVGRGALCFGSGIGGR